MSTSKQDYQKIASIIAAEYTLAADKKYAKLAIENLTANIADHLAGTNPRFDREKFYQAALGRTTVRPQ